MVTYKYNQNSMKYNNINKKYFKIKVIIIQKKASSCDKLRKIV